MSKFKRINLKKIVPSNLDIKSYQKLDTFWHLSVLFMKHPPNWQGFMSSIIHGHHSISHISYHPMIPLNPSSYQAVYSTLVFVNDQIKKKKICCTSLTFDQPLYWKVSEIKEDKAPELDSMHLKLGGFHQLMSFLGAGCKLMQDAGLAELWTSVYKENSLPKMMEGKAYSRCLRVCLLTDSSLHHTSLSANDGASNTDEYVYEPIDTFDDTDEIIDLDSNIFEVLNDEKINDAHSEEENENETSLKNILLETNC